MQAQEAFGVRLLRQARQRAQTRPPGAAGQPHDALVLAAAGDALDQLIDHMVALPAAQQTEAVTLIAFGMLVEHLRLATVTPSLRDRLLVIEHD